MENFVILREKYSSRGGGVEIDLSNLGYHDEKMTAYQNYLGGWYGRWYRYRLYY